MCWVSECVRVWVCFISSSLRLSVYEVHRRWLALKERVEICTQLNTIRLVCAHQEVCGSCVNFFVVFVDSVGLAFTHSLLKWMCLVYVELFIQVKDYNSHGSLQLTHSAPCAPANVLYHLSKSSDAIFSYPFAIWQNQNGISNSCSCIAHEKNACKVSLYFLSKVRPTKRASGYRQTSAPEMDESCTDFGFFAAIILQTALRLHYPLQHTYNNWNRVIAGANNIPSTKFTYEAMRITFMLCYTFDAYEIWASRHCSWRKNTLLNVVCKEVFAFAKTSYEYHERAAQTLLL